MTEPLSNDLPSDYSGLVRFSTRSYCVVPCFVHISCLCRIQFHLEHIHLQFSGELCGPSGSVDPAYSQQKWCCPTACQTCLCFRGPVPSRPPQGPRWLKELNVFYLKKFFSLYNIVLVLSYISMNILPPHP